MKIPTYWLFGSKQQILKSGQDTGDKYDVIEGFFPPGSQSPLHVHSKYTETIVIIMGEAIVYTPLEKHVLKEGNSYFIPKNIPHAVVNNSDTNPFIALAIASPSGFAELIQSVGILQKGKLEAPLEHDMQLAMQVMNKLGDTILGPSGARP
jgi:quercetin dioxygenase-like cupin family protein